MGLETPKCVFSSLNLSVDIVNASSEYAHLSR